MATRWSSTRDHAVARGALGVLPPVLRLAEVPVRALEADARGIDAVALEEADQLGALDDVLTAFVGQTLEALTDGRSLTWSCRLSWPPTIFSVRLRVQRSKGLGLLKHLVGQLSLLGEVGNGLEELGASPRVAPAVSKSK